MFLLRRGSSGKKKQEGRQIAELQKEVERLRLHASQLQEQVGCGCMSCACLGLDSCREVLSGLQ